MAERIEQAWILITEDGSQHTRITVFTEDVCSKQVHYVKIAPSDAEASLTAFDDLQFALAKAENIAYNYMQAGWQMYTPYTMGR